jgi:uncharacterized protein (UPF0332 family)
VDKQTRLAGARQALEGAKVLLAHADFRGCASRCYYAAYQAMWAALGEPEKKPRWEHFGIIKSFVRGRWLNPHVSFRGPGVFESQRFALHRLYDLRLKADYRLDDIGQEEAQWAIQTAQEIIAIAEQKDARDAT